VSTLIEHIGRAASGVMCECSSAVGLGSLIEGKCFSAVGVGTVIDRYLWRAASGVM